MSTFGTLGVLGCGVALVAALMVAGTGQPNAAAAIEPPAKSSPKKEKTLTWENLQPEETSPKRDDKLVLTEAEWKARLTPDQFNILRSHGTDPAFCGILEDHKEAGAYNCAGCDLPLFQSENKFNSGTGWPSFFMPVARKNVWFRTDKSYGMTRVEVLCAKCDGHLGHVFPDGPNPSGLRFCINGNALKFKVAAKS